jgi:hypothetical protein
MAALFGAPLFAPIARAAGLVGKDQRPVISEGPPSVQVFNPPQRALMTQLSERIVPTTDTPGAIKAGVPDYIEKPEQLDGLLTAAMNAQLPDGAAFFGAFRQLVITGYYTSEIGMTQEQEYLPVPGEYHGDYLYSNVNKVYSA